MKNHNKKNVYLNKNSKLLNFAKCFITKIDNNNKEMFAFLIIYHTYYRKSEIMRPAKVC